MSASHTTQVRVVENDRSSSYFYFPEVEVERAVELAEYHAAALCMSVERYEVYGDVYSNPYLEAPLAVAYPNADRSRLFAFSPTNLER